jgi:hypothetical protein
MATITLIKQLRNWLNGTLVPTRLKRKSKSSELSVEPTIAVTPQPASPQAIQNSNAVCQQVYVRAMQRYTAPMHMAIDRFASYKEKIMPKLQEQGYLYFRAASSNEYQVHEEWCHEHCDSPTLPFCDVWQFDAQYPRAFKNETDATMFALTFDSTKIDAMETKQ